MTRIIVGVFMCAVFVLPTACAPGATGFGAAGPVVYVADAAAVFVVVREAIENAPAPYGSDGWHVGAFVGQEGFVRAEAASVTEFTVDAGGQTLTGVNIRGHTVTVDVTTLEGGRVSVTIETSTSDEARGLAARIRLALARAFTIA